MNDQVLIPAAVQVTDVGNTCMCVVTTATDHFIG